MMTACFCVNTGKGCEFSSGFREIGLFRVVQKHIWSHQRACIPLFRIAQGNGKCPQDAAGTLESFDLGPAGVEDFGDVRVKGIAVYIAFFRVSPLLLGLVVECGNTAHY